jgi:hypothetical protein
LEETGNYSDYLERLESAFNPETLPKIMCRYQISAGRNGRNYDCNFNQAADLPSGGIRDIGKLAETPSIPRKIRFGEHWLCLYSRKRFQRKHCCIIKKKKIVFRFSLTQLILRERCFTDPLMITKFLIFTADILLIYSRQPNIY